MTKKQKQQLVENIKGSMVMILKNTCRLEEKDMEDLFFRLVSLQLKTSMLCRKSKRV